MAEEKGKFFEKDGSIKKKYDAGYFKIVDATENDDGTTSYQFEYDEEFILFYKLKTGRKRVTQKGITKFILKIMEEQKKGGGEGYTIKKEKDKSRRKFYKVYK